MNAMQPPQSVEEVKATLETTEKGGVRQSIRNCLTVFQRDPVLAGAIAYNILTDRKDIIKPIGFHRESTALTDTDMKYLLLYLEETYGLTSEKKIETAIGIVANENKYHPIRDFLNSLAWDGTERIRCCLRHFLGADVDDYTYEALKLFMLGAITRAFKPGSKFEIMLCLVGGQGAAARGYSRRLVLACLLHDASECYMSDVPRPLKQEMPRYREIEDHLLSVIYEKYLGSDLTAEEQRMMKQIDNDLLWYDLTNLLEEPQAGDAPKLHITLDYTVRPFAAVEQEYLELFEQYRETGDERG